METPKEININELADTLALYFEAEGQPASHMKMHKLLYYIQAWHLVHFGHPLFADRPQAWVNGPVYRQLYETYSGLRMHDPIIHNGNRDEIVALQKSRFADIKSKLSATQLKYLNSVLNRYGFKDGNELSYSTHTERPWNEAREGLGPLDYCEKEISHESMRQYYSSLLKGGSE